MADPKVKRVLMSVTDKTGVVEFARALSEEFGAQIISTGGTARVIAEAGIPVTPIDEVTQFPEMMDGRVKTLHPAVHGGLLAKRDNPEHMAQAAEHGIEMLDCPVSGGEPKAIDGTLSVMCGGKKELFDKYYDMLMVMAGSVVYVGDLGSGNVAKLANQMVVAINIAAVAEALTFAKKAGTDPELVYQAIRGGLAGSTVMDAKAPMMLAGNYKPGFRIELHIKDLNNALNAAHAISSPAPLTAEMMEIMQFLRSEGCDKDDHSSIVKYYEKISGTSIVK